METIRIGIAGGPNSGKTVLAMELTIELKKNGIVAQYVPEYIRKWTPKHNKNHPGLVTEQFAITIGQMNRERYYSNGQDVIITDGPAWLSPAYASLIMKENMKNPDYNNYLSDSVHIGDLIEFALLGYPYDMNYFLPGGIFDLQKEAGRFQTSEDEIAEAEQKILSMLDLYNVPIKRMSKIREEWNDIIMDDITKMVLAKKK